MIAKNHKPGLRAVDEAIRRRFNLIPRLGARSLRGRYNTDYPPPTPMFPTTLTPFSYGYDSATGVQERFFWCLCRLGRPYNHAC
jgi:hypothetical protein